MRRSSGSGGAPILTLVSEGPNGLRSHLPVPGICAPNVPGEVNSFTRGTRIYKIAGFIPTRSALACQSLALIAGSTATLLAVLTFLFAKN